MDNKMTSREIVSRAIHFRNPPRLPVTMQCFGADDTGSAYGKPPEGWKASVPGEDEWSCVWEKTAMANMGQVKGHPLMDISKLKTFRPPDYRASSRYVDVEAALAKVESQGKYAMTGIFMVLFERMHSLHGFEDTLVDLYTDRPAMEDLADMIVEAHVTLVREYSRRFPGRINGWCMSATGERRMRPLSASTCGWISFFHAISASLMQCMRQGAMSGCTRAAR
jgi:uroporphyrinogen decarboxylase